MKTFAQFIKENYHIQEKLDAEVYGELRYGAPPVRQKSKKEISDMVGKAIDHAKAGTVDTTKGTPARKRKLSFGGHVNLSYEKKSGGGKTPPPTKVRPDKTTDPKGTKVKPDKPKNTNKGGTKTKIKTTKTIKTVAVKGNGGRPNKPSNDVRPIKTSTPAPIKTSTPSSTNVLTKGSNTSSPSPSPSPSSTKVLTKKPTPPPTPVRPVRGV